MQYLVGQMLTCLLGGGLIGSGDWLGLVGDAAAASRANARRIWNRRLRS